jgi:hypothetical protein
MSAIGLKFARDHIDWLAICGVFLASPLLLIIPPVLYRRRRSLIHQIGFDYLPTSSPLEHGWKFADEDNVGTMPTVTELRDAMVSTRTIVSIKAQGWYGLDYSLPHISVYDSVRFTARFAENGVLYLKSRIWNPEGHERTVWLAQPPVGGTIPHGDGSIEWRVSMPTKVLPNGWILFDLSLPHQMRATLSCSEYRLLGIRVRGSLEVSSAEFFGSNQVTQPSKRD